MFGFGHISLPGQFVAPASRWAVAVDSVYGSGWVQRDRLGCTRTVTDPNEATTYVSQGDAEQAADNLRGRGAAGETFRAERLP